VRTREEMKASLETAFLPLRCVAEFRDYRARLTARVYDETDEPILRILPIVVREFRTDSALNTLIRWGRERLITRGYRLSPLPYK
jgi:hypothetical protein